MWFNRRSSDDSIVQLGFLFIDFSPSAVDSFPAVAGRGRVVNTSIEVPGFVMASEIERGGDELDGSLFEGMVLFSPSDLLPAELPPEKEPDAPSPSQNQTRLTQLDHPSPSCPTVSATGMPASPHSKSQPLDEDIFSDLAVQVPVRQADHVAEVSAPAPTPSLAGPSRQISRKKKRALRIGYGRESHDMTSAASIDDFSQDVTGDVISDSTPSSVGHDEGLPDPSGHNEVEALKIAQDITAPGDDVRLSPPQCCISEVNTEAAPLTMDTSEKDNGLGLIEEKLTILRSGIFAKLQQIRETATSLYAERKEFERRRRKAAQDVNQAKTTYKDLEKELEKACEDEEFERAERVSESLAAMEKEKDRLLCTLRETELNCDSVDSKMQEVFQLHIAVEEEGIGLLQQFAKDAVDRADLIYRNAEELSSKELDQWQSSIEMLEMNKFEIEIEAELLLDARSELDSSIEDLVKDDRKEIEELTKKQVVLAKEFEELMKLVRLKEAEITENESRIEEAKKKMSDVVLGFQETSSSVGMKHDSLMSAMSRIHSEQEILSSKKNEIDQFISLTMQKCSTLRELASDALMEAKTCEDLVGLRKKLASSILESREDKVMLVRTEEKVLEEIQILQQQISSARTTLQELSTNRLSIQQGIDSYKQRIAFVDKRGPELEAEKKVAAAARNFKEAGRIAAEAKALNSEKENVQHKANKAILDLDKLEEQIKATISIMQDNEELVLLKEKEAAVASFQRLQLLAAAARAERSAALELGDDEEGEFLSKEIEAAEERARELQEAFSLHPTDRANAREYFFPVSLITQFSG